ncbi:MAG TPA: serine--tRNA ligase [Rhizomicrobium sp.]
MHDIAAIRKDRDAWVAALARRPAYAAEAGRLADDILGRDAELRELVTQLQQKQAQRNEASKLIGQAKAKKDEARAAELMAEVSGLKDDIQKGEDRERELKAALDKVLAEIPNLPGSDVPPGEDENANVPVEHRYFRNARAVPADALNDRREHYELGESLGMMDFERAAKVSGSRFVYLSSGLARLERAIANFMLDLHTGEFGYTEFQPPVLVKNDAMFGTGQLPKFKDDQFFSASMDWREHRLNEILQPLNSEIERRHKPPAETVSELLQEAETVEQFWLIPTAEVSLTNYVREEILDEDSLPRRYTAWTPCFRAEAGAAGKDTRGMIRMHQFSKVELVSITTPEKSDEEHERMTDCAQEVLKRLNLHHRVVTLCAGDMGFSAKKTYDIEVWLPGQNRFREISSCSNCGDFQARRMSTRYRGKEGKVKGYVHTLNGSGLAVGRTLIAILENYQEADGSIAIPDALKPYMGGMTRIEKQ